MSSPPHRLAVTTCDKAPPALAAHARQRALGWQLPFVARPKGPLTDALSTVAAAFLVFGRDGLTLQDRHGRLGFYLGMAKLRRLALERGQDDPLVRVAALQEGDHVLDATLGLAHDALVAAYAVGPTGRVLGIEKSLPLYALVEEGLRRRGPSAVEAPVTTVHADAAEHLASLPPRSFDLVIFDPMFSRPRNAEPGFDMLRRYADPTPLSAALLTAGQRVARRAVVVKAPRYADDLARLGLRPEPTSRYAAVVYAVVPAQVGDLPPEALTP